MWSWLPLLYRMGQLPYIQTLICQVCPSISAIIRPQPLLLTFNWIGTLYRIFSHNFLSDGIRKELPGEPWNHHSSKIIPQHSEHCLYNLHSTWLNKLEEIEGMHSDLSELQHTTCCLILHKSQKTLSTLLENSVCDICTTIYNMEAYLDQVTGNMDMDTGHCTVLESTVSDIYNSQQSAVSWPRKHGHGQQRLQL